MRAREVEDEVFAAIERCLLLGAKPTIRLLMHEVGLRSTSHCSAILDRLVARGLIAVQRIEGGQSGRSLRLRVVRQKSQMPCPHCGTAIHLQNGEQVAT